MMRRVALVGIALTLGLAAACGDSASETTIPAELPDAHAVSFVEQIDDPNRYWPLAVGSQWVYEGMDEGEFEHIEVSVEQASRDVMGVSAVVVRDVVTLEDGVIEDTFDWYAQDTTGCVWYLGEDSKEIEDGKVVSTEGSWEAGIDGAKAGVIMWPDPIAHVGQPYFQEFYEDEAVDKAEVLRIGDPVTVAAGTFEDVLVIREWDPLEPGITELKYYAPGIGLILEEIEEGGEARIELISYTLG